MKARTVRRSWQVDSIESTDPASEEQSTPALPTSSISSFMVTSKNLN